MLVLKIKKNIVLKTSVSKNHKYFVKQILHVYNLAKFAQKSWLGECGVIKSKKIVLKNLINQFF